MFLGTVDDWTAEGTVVSWYPTAASHASAAMAVRHPAPVSYQQSQHLHYYRRQTSLGRDIPRLCIGVWEIMVTWLGAGFVVLLFFNPGVAPAGVFPAWLQPAVQLQPMSPTIEAMRGLAEGGPVLWPLVQAAAWAAALVVVFAPAAVRGYRAAAEAGCR